VGESSRSTYRNNNAIAIPGNTKIVRGIRSEGKYEAENSAKCIVKFPIGMTLRFKMNLLQIAIDYSISKNF
jgi:hypothetical protein